MAISSPKYGITRGVRGWQKRVHGKVVYIASLRAAETGEDADRIYEQRLALPRWDPRRIRPYKPAEKVDLLLPASPPPPPTTEPFPDLKREPILGLCVAPQWGALIRSGAKRIETRSWSTRHRGLLLITTSKKGAKPGMPGGVMCCVAELAEVRKMVPADSTAACTPYKRGMFAWIFRDVWPVKQRNVRSSQGFFRVEAEDIEPEQPT